MTSEESFNDLMARLRSGEDEAANQVFLRFARRLVGLARGHLDTRLAAKVDPEDVVQSVLKSFMHRHALEQFELRGWDSLWGLLAQITARKCGRQVQYFRRARRDVRRESAAPAAAGDSDASWGALLPDPTQAEATTLTDSVTGLWARFVRNTYTSEYDASESPVFPAMLQSRAAQDIFGHAVQHADPAWLPMPTGQSVGLVHDLPGAGEVVERIVREARAVLDRLR